MNTLAQNEWRGKSGKDLVVAITRLAVGEKLKIFRFTTKRDTTASVSRPQLLKSVGTPKLPRSSILATNHEPGHAIFSESIAQPENIFRVVLGLPTSQRCRSKKRPHPELSWPNNGSI